jgi:tetratricopeptide (TPR) repeat protein
MTRPALRRLPGSMPITRLLHRWTLSGVTVLALLAGAPYVAIAQGASVACPGAAGPSLEAGWAALRANDLAAARRAFETAEARCPTADGATGRGYVALRREDLATARAAFDRALARDSQHFDALSGRALVAHRTGDVATTRAAFERALRIVPDDSLARAILASLPAPIDTSPLPARVRPAETVVAARAGTRRLEVPDGRGGFRPLWVKAMNIGAALPGRHPSEFPPDDGTYEAWLALVDSLGANAVRVYTIHPPHFYRALAAWNRAHPARPLWLLHGVWTEPPPGEHEERYDDPAWAEAFRDEMRRVVDLVHGHAIIPHRPGHASGRYDADVSRWTLGWIIGREWEPYSVVGYAARRPRDRTYQGRFVSSEDGNALETWMARVSDWMLAYEMDTWNAQRPLAYTNWPTLDPLHHPTESTKDEETAWLRRRGETLPERNKEYDNDAIGLDARKLRASAAYPAGVFASYHAYPYYPDFLVLDSAYNAARSPEGPSAYFGYLQALVAHHGDMPLVISEVGVPSSRGNAHLQPQGWDHGGHDERAKGAIDARLVREIHAADAAGVGMFALLDEWFKKNWLVIDFEQPLERNRLWFNPLDAEQNYGLIALRPGHRDSAITIDGRRDDWRDRGRWYEAPVDSMLPAPLQLRALRVTHDEGWVYLRLDVGALDWSRGRYLVGISTVSDSTGDRVLPRTGTRAPVGLEFVLDLQGPDDAMLLVDTPYTLYRRLPVRGARVPDSVTVYNRPFRSVANADGRYDTLRVAPNRRRLTRAGRVVPERLLERNRLRHAPQSETTLADWYADPATGTIEVRLPWGLLHVLDPSSHQVLQGRPGARDPEAVTTAGFRFVVQSYAPAAPRAGGDRLPRGDAPGEFGLPPRWRWPAWEQPAWHAEVKRPVFDALRATFTTIDDGARR